MNSIPQHEVAKGSGHSEFLRASPTILSRLVAKKPGPSNPSGALTISTIWYYYLNFAWFFSTLFLFPFKGSLFHDVQETKHEQTNENYHFNKTIESKFQEINGPWIHENNFYIK